MLSKEQQKKTENILLQYETKPLIFVDELREIFLSKPYYFFKDWVNRSTSLEVHDFLYDNVYDYRKPIKEPSYSADYIYNYLEQQESYSELKEVLNTLTEREKTVLTLRFGLDDNKPQTLEQIGKVFNVTRERIRSIEAKALRKMRHPQRYKRLLKYLDYLPLFEEKLEKERKPETKRRKPKEVIYLSDSEANRAIEKLNKEIKAEKEAIKSKKSFQSGIRHFVDHIKEQEEKRERELQKALNAEKSQAFRDWYDRQAENIRKAIDPELEPRFFEGNCQCKTWRFNYSTYLNNFPIGCLRCQTKFIMQVSEKQYY